MHTPTDWDVVAQHLRGDRRAFGVLVTRYDRQLRIHLYRYFKHVDADDRRELIADLLQDVWFRLHKHAATLNTTKAEGATGVAAWLYRVATNLAINAQRNRSRRNRVLQRMPLFYNPDTHEMEEVELADTNAVPTDWQCEANDLQDFVARTLPTVASKEQRQVLDMKARGLKYDAMAVRVGKSVGTVKSRLHRGRAALAQVRQRAYGH